MHTVYIHESNSADNCNSTGSVNSAGSCDSAKHTAEKSSARKLRPSEIYKATCLEFLIETSVGQRVALRRGLVVALSQLFAAHRTVYLEGFGFLRASPAMSERVQALGASTVSQPCEVVEVVFEKSEQPIHGEMSSSGVIETEELAARIACIDSYFARWTPARLRRALRGFVEWMKYQVVRDGCCRLLEELGVFYSMRNRSGNSFREWFAGADIFFEQHKRYETAQGPRTTWPRQVETSAWHPLEQLWGGPTYCLEVKGSDGSSVVRVAEFRRSFGASQSIAAYCTDGLRRASFDNGSYVGGELIFQVSTGGSDAFRVPDEILQKLVHFGHHLVCAAHPKGPYPGQSLLGGGHLLPDLGSSGFGFLTTKFDGIPMVQLSSEGPFSYLNLIALCKDEVSLLERYSSDLLLALLRRKCHDQVNVFPRRSVTFASGFLEPAASRSLMRHPTLLPLDDDHAQSVFDVLRRGETYGQRKTEQPFGAAA